jgi:hypothetical protein
MALNQTIPYRRLLLKAFAKELPLFQKINPQDRWKHPQGREAIKGE